MEDYKSLYINLKQENNRLKQGSLLKFQEIEIEDLKTNIDKLTNKINDLRNRNKLLHKKVYSKPMNKVTWKYIMEMFIRIKWKPDELFTLQEIYNLYNDVLQKLYPDNNTIKASIRRTLENLRDDNIIKFLDNNGSYSLV